MSGTASRIAEFEREIEEIRRSGADLTRPHHIGHSLRFVRREDAESAGQRVREYGVFDVSIIDELIDGCWIIYASQEQVLSAHHLEQSRSAMERLAAEFCGKYEDWQVGVHMDDWPDCGCTWPDG